MTFSSRSSSLLQLQGSPHPECTDCHHFDMHFSYILSGWEGSASDGGVYHDAQVHDLSIPVGKYYLAMMAIPSVMHCWCHFGVSTIISESERSERNLGYGSCPT